MVVEQVLLFTETLKDYIADNIYIHEETTSAQDYFSFLCVVVTYLSLFLAAVEQLFIFTRT